MYANRPCLQLWADCMGVRFIGFTPRSGALWGSGITVSEKSFRVETGVGTNLLPTVVDPVTQSHMDPDFSPNREGLKSVSSSTRAKLNYKGST